MNTDEIKETLEVASQNIEDLNVPDGYLTYHFSTKGRFGAPPTVHVRNFSTEEVLSLSLTDQEDLPAKVGQLLQGVLLESPQETDVLQWHENEVVELLVFIYKSFYGTSLKDVQYTLNDEDYECMKMLMEGKQDEYLEWKRDVENGHQKYFFDINLDEKVDFYPIDLEKKYELRVKNAKLDATFSWPRYGDSVVLLQALKEVYGEKDKEYEGYYKAYKFRQQAEAKFLKGENINLQAVPELSAENEKKVKAYELEKSQFLTTLTKALHIVSINGMDVRDLELSKKVEAVSTPLLDFATYQKVSDAFLNIKVGVVPDIKIKSPITGEEIEYHYPFRVFDILSAIKDYSDNGTVVEFV